MESGLGNRREHSSISPGCDGATVHKVVIPREEPLVYRAAGMGNWEPWWMARDGPQYKKRKKKEKKKRALFLWEIELKFPLDF